MFTTIIILSILCALQTVMLFFSIRRSFDLDSRFVEMADQVEESLDILDDCYRRIAAIAETPVASDDPTVQQLIQDIKYTKHAILLVANKIVTFDKAENGEE